MTDRLQFLEWVELPAADSMLSETMMVRLRGLIAVLADTPT